MGTVFPRIIVGGDYLGEGDYSRARGDYFKYCSLEVVP